MHNMEGKLKNVASLEFSFLLVGGLCIRLIFQCNKLQHNNFARRATLVLTRTSRGQNPMSFVDVQ